MTFLETLCEQLHNTSTTYGEMTASVPNGGKMRSYGITSDNTTVEVTEYHGNDLYRLVIIEKKL